MTSNEHFWHKTTVEPAEPSDCLLVRGKREFFHNLDAIFVVLAIMGHHYIFLTNLIAEIQEIVLLLQWSPTQANF